MATITNDALIQQMGDRIRPAAEAFIGIGALLSDVAKAMDAVSAGTDPHAVIDSAGPVPFTVTHWGVFRALIGQVLAGVGEPSVADALEALRVRARIVIYSSYAGIGEDVKETPARRVLINYIRPAALILRAWRYRANDYTRILAALLAGLNPLDVIDDGRAAEGVLPVPVMHALVLVGFMSAMISPGVNNDMAGAAIDAACGLVPLGVGY